MFLRSSVGPLDPCGSWQSEHAILGGEPIPVFASGCPERCRISARWARWQVTQTSAWVALFITF